ncbi:MAG: transcriptional regulator HexR [Bacillota bacterium]
MALEGFPNIVDRIRDNLHAYSNAERKVGEVLLARPEAVINMSIAKLAGLAEVSEPTVVRFCRSFGFEGFRDFKLRLAQELAAGVTYAHSELKPGDDAATYIRKVGRSTIDVLSNVVTRLDPDHVEYAVATLTSAQRIEFFGFGASAAVAADAYHKFFRLGVPCAAHADSHMQCMSASTLGANDVVVAISHTGRSADLIENVRLARRSGATVIGITQSDSPLARESSLVLGVDLDENTDVFTPMLSRLAHLLLVDILVIGVTLRRGHQVTQRLQRMKSALALKRLKDLGEDEHA